MCDGGTPSALRRGGSGAHQTAALPSRADPLCLHCPSLLLCSCFLLCLVMRLAAARLSSCGLQGNSTSRQCAPAVCRVCDVRHVRCCSSLQVSTGLADLVAGLCPLRASQQLCAAGLFCCLLCVQKARVSASLPLSLSPVGIALIVCAFLCLLRRPLLFLLLAGLRWVDDRTLGRQGPAHAPDGPHHLATYIDTATRCQRVRVKDCVDWARSFVWVRLFPL